MSILVAGIGNIFLGDDAFGVEVVQRLGRRALPADVTVRDFGIRGRDLAYALTERWDAAILVDAAPRGGSPGTLYVIEPSSTGETQLLEAHGMDPVKVLAMARQLGGVVPCVRVVGCEPGHFGRDDDPAMGLSEAVARALDPAVELVEELIGQLRREVAHA